MKGGEINQKKKDLSFSFIFFLQEDLGRAFGVGEGGFDVGGAGMVCHWGRGSGREGGGGSGGMFTPLSSTMMDHGTGLRGLNYSK